MMRGALLAVLIRLAEILHGSRQGVDHSHTPNRKRRVERNQAQHRDNRKHSDERHPSIKVDALKAGIIQGVSSFEELSNVALIKAKELSPLANNRKNFGHQKEMLYRENAAINLAHGPAYMLKNSKDFEV